MERRKRRSFTPEFRAEAVRLVREGSKSRPQVAKDLNLTESALRNWVEVRARSRQSRSPLPSERNWCGCARRYVIWKWSVTS